MQLPKKHHTFFYKLMVSYTTIVIIVTLLISSISIYYYSDNYKKQLVNVNYKILTYLNTIIDETIIQDTIMTYVNMSISSKNNREFLNLFNVPLKGNFADINPTINYLQHLVVSSNSIIDSINIYYSNNDIILSSSHGLVYRDKATELFAIDYLWLNEFQNGDQNSFWTPQQIRSLGGIESGENRTVAYVKGFPTLATPTDYKGIICINVNELTLKNLLTKQKIDNEAIHIIDQDGRMVASTEDYTHQNSFVESAPYIADVLRDTNSINHKTIEHMGIEYVVSYITVPTTGWRIIHQTPIDTFYKDLNKIRAIILLISLSSIVLGIIITAVLSYNMYNPLKQITKRLNDTFKKPMVTDKARLGEYGLINSALDQLTNKVNSLEVTLNENKPLIKHNIVIGLMNFTIKESETLNNLLQLLNYTFSKPYFNVMVIKFKVTSGNETDQPSFPQSEIYGLIKIFESLELEDYQFLATELPDYEVGIIVNSEHDQLTLHIDVLGKVLNSIFNDTVYSPHAFIGNSVNRPELIFKSFNDIKILKKYSYFLPNHPIIAGQDILNRETSLEKLSPELIDNLRKVLNLKDISLLESCIHEIIQEMQDGFYSYDHCHARLINMASMFSNYIRDMGIDTHTIVTKTILQDFNNAHNILMFSEWLLDIARKSFDYLDQRAQNKNYVFIDSAKDYILNHLEEDLSLDILAAEVGLSPRYLSRLFKEYTGENFTEFVTRHRMDYSRKLLLASSLTISAVSDRLGFSNPAYFIKKFKVAYGMTPNEYRVQQHFKQSQ